ncbi:MAG: ribonuclease P protein component [Pseudomonadota bacterium]|nr:ribonuclease P protein component [Pseudomonadota bacterium]
MSYATLKKRSEFVRVAQVRNMTRTPTVWVQCFSNKDDETKNVRVGFTASRKAGNAVCRNRGKRRMRDLARYELPQVLSEFPNFSGDFVIIAIPATVTAGYTEIVRNFKDAVRNCLRHTKTH